MYNDISIEGARAELECVRRMNAEHLRRIGEKTRELTRENGWCSIPARAMQEVGVPIEEKKVTRNFRLTVTYDVTASLTEEAVERRPNPNPSAFWISSSLPNENLVRGVVFDSDWDPDSVSVSVIEQSVTDIREVD